MTAAAHIVIEERNFAFQNRLQTFSLVNRDHIDVHIFFEDAFQYFEQKIKPIVDSMHIVKIATCLCAIFEKIVISTDGDRRETQTIYIHTLTLPVDFDTDLKNFYSQYVVAYITKKIDDIQLQGSGFTLAEIKELNVQISRFDGIAGSSYIDLPKFLKDKKAIVNVKNKDNKCFKYAVLSALYPAEENAHRPNKYSQYENHLDFTGIQFPVELKQIKKFEQQNPSISINVYMFDIANETIHSMRLTEEVKEKHIHLLMLTKETDDDTFKIFHYCWIKKLNALLGKQVSSWGHRLFFCDRCLNHFMSEEKLKMHLINCMKQNKCQIEMPTEENDTIFFKNHKNQLKVPFVIYADVESLLKKIDEKFHQAGNTKAYQLHEAYSIGYYFKSLHDTTKSYYKSYRGPDCIDWFTNELKEISNTVESVLSEVKPLEMSEEDQVLFMMGDICCICRKEFEQNEQRVRDHSHLTGEFRGAAHNSCNLNYQESRYVPVVFHNLSHYDAHFLIKKIATFCSGNVSIIPLNNEKYISFTKHMPPKDKKDKKDFKQQIKFRFIDSFRFMASSLDYLSSLLPSNRKKILQCESEQLTATQREFLERKGVFCYDYVDSWEKLNETSLPPREEFYSKLTESDVSDSDYEFACNVWKEFNISTLGEYSDLYLKTDVLLLADIFENFRDTCYSIYKLDPANYYTAPGLSFDAMLKYTNVEIELFTDIDMLLFIERGIRGGISECAKRYVKANNKYLSDFDPNKKSTFLAFLDANNLYGYSMMQHLPISNFVWCHEEFDVEKILNIADDSSIGYIFEVTLLYPESLHEKHKFYPLCSEKRNVPGTKNMRKLLLTLHDKENYVIHYKMLKFVLQQGLILKQVHRTLQFKQEQWLKPFVDLNTDLRTKAENDFEKNFFKLMINAIYGKTMENVRARVIIQLKTYWEGRYGARKLIAQPDFKKFTVFAENLVAVEMNKTSIFMNKCIVVGFTVLDLSKILMADFFYNYIQKKYGDTATICYTDTDSYVMELETEDFYADMLHDLHMYDTSDFPENNIHNIPRANKKVPGLFKSELNEVVISEFVGLRSKMYCVKAGGVEKKKKAKGIKSCVVKKNITFEDYIDCIKNNCSIQKNQNTFRSKNHEIYTIRQQKIALSPFDDKRYILDNNINTLPWGHFNIENVTE